MSKSLQQLELEIAAFRAAKANAGAEVARLQEHRQRLLLTSTVDAIISLDDEIRRQQIAAEVATAKADDLRGPIHQARFIAQKYSGADMPTDDELERLYAIVVAKHPWLNLEREAKRTEHGDRDFMGEFRNALYAIARMRRSEPGGDRYWASMVDDANGVLRSHRLGEVEGDALLCAAIAHGDVAWRRADASLGQLLEVGLAPLHQGKPAASRWRQILNGEPLLPPMSPRGMRNPESSYPAPRVRITYPDSGREVDPAAPLWAQ